MLTKRDNLLIQCHSLIVIVDQAQNISTDYHSFQQAAHINSEKEAMHRLRMTALAGVLALSTSGSESSKTTFQPDLSVFFPKKPAQPTNQKPEYPVGLIASTNVQQRLKQLQQGQSDPFMRLFPPQVETATKPEKVLTDLPKLPIKKELPAPIVKVVPPSTELAESVAVEGVMQLGNKTRAIVRVPSDGTSRYVSEGQRLSDGQLLVKRIEISPDSEPLVVLEQNGIEISKAVGEQTDESTDTIASSTLSQIGSDYEGSDEESSDEKTSDKQAADPQQVRGQEEYTAAIPVPSLPPTSSSSQKKLFDEAASSPPPTNSLALTDTDTASVREDYPNSELPSSNSESSSLRDGRKANRLRHRIPDGLGQDSFANRQYRSSFDLSKNQPASKASLNIEDSDRKQRLIDKLRSGSKPEIENTIASDSPSTLQADLGHQTYQQQPIRSRLGYKKPKATSNELSTSSSNIEVLAHRQRLINELRRTTRHTNQ